MGFVKVETQIGEKKLSFEIESNGLYQINCLSYVINKPDKIIEILITDDIIFILTEDRDFRLGALQAPIYKNERRNNNLDAYDWKGQHLWNIGDIVGDIKTNFTGATLTTNKNLVIEKIVDVHNEYSANILICFAGAYRYIIDPKNKTIISKTNGKW